MGNFTLGLDLGANSIGWALLDEPNQAIIASGVRVFPEGVDNFDTKKEKSKSEDRRVVRGMRRQIARRARRKRRLREALVSAGLLPSNLEALQAILKLDPYALRSRALDEPVSIHEFGRILLHLNQRRGFLSNRKSDRERKAETKGMLAEINELAAIIRAEGSRTVGEHFAKCLQQNPLEPIRGHHTRRDMFEEEFERLWESQRPHHPDLFTDELKYGFGGKLPAVREPAAPTDGKSMLQSFGVYGLIFFQRPMYWPKSVVGQCELEPKRKRCPRADRLAQRFRLLQEVNNLRYIDPDTGDEKKLTPEQRTLLLDKLSRIKEMTFDQIRKALQFLDSIPFNLENGKRTKVQGMVTDTLLADKKIFGTDWHKRPEDEKTQIARKIIIGDEAEIRRFAREDWGLDAEQTERLLEVDLPEGYIRLSITALEKLVPPMERGLLYMTADGTPSALSEAGYLRPDQIRRKVLDALPDPPDVTNPVVRQALHELRKVVNSIIRKFGKPGRIHLELARNAAASSDERAKMAQRMREREAERDAAADAIREHGVKVTREAIDRYLLWQEQSEVCIYSGDAISMAQLFGGEIHIDHILPYSRCLDDSFANKVVCFTKANKDKGNKTPYEWLADREKVKFEKIRQRSYKLPYGKRKRFTQKELELDKFIERQLNDTRYISRAAMEYLRCLYAEPHLVLCPKGSHTETFRWLWGLNTVLRQDSVNRKNRTDHRHHAIDAIVLALTDQRRLQALSQAKKYDTATVPAERLAEPWEGFRSAVEQSIVAINVSFRVCRKLSGALHKDNIFGRVEMATVESGDGNSVITVVRRKKLEELDNTKHIEKVRDPGIKKILVDYLAERGVNCAKPQKFANTIWKDQPKMRSGVPIKRVRLEEQGEGYREIRPNALVELANNHHIEIYELIDQSGNSLTDSNGSPRRVGVVVSTLEASHSIRHSQMELGKLRKELAKKQVSSEEAEELIAESIAQLSRKNPIVRRDRVPNARFVMSLSRNEMVLLELSDGTIALHRVQKMSPGVIILRPHTYSGKVSDTDKPPIIQRRTPNTLRGKKVTVTPLGDIRWAND